MSFISIPLKFCTCVHGVCARLQLLFFLLLSFAYFCSFLPVFSLLFPLTVFTQPFSYKRPFGLVKFLAETYDLVQLEPKIEPNRLLLQPATSMIQPVSFIMPTFGQNLPICSTVSARTAKIARFVAQHVSFFTTVYTINCHLECAQESNYLHRRCEVRLQGKMSCRIDSVAIIDFSRF